MQKLLRKLSKSKPFQDARRRAEERVGTLQVSGRYHRLPRSWA